MNFIGALSQYRHSEYSPICMNPGTQMSTLGTSMPELALPGSNSGFCMLSPNVGLPGSAIPGITGFKEQPYRADQLIQQLRPYHGHPTSLPRAWPWFEGEQSTFDFGYHEQVPANAVCGTMQKGFMVFDRSGNQTQLIYSSVQHPAPYLTEGKAVKDGPPLQPVLPEHFGKNHPSADHSEMHEDTEEINALLYSDEDEEDYSDDEVISTDHSPPVPTKRKYQMPEQRDNLTEEVASSNGPHKRQKLLNGRCMISSSPCSDKLDASNEYNSDAESSYAIGQNETKHTPKPSKKDNIRMTLKILESIIPGTKGKDPVIVLDEAIHYLKSLKLGAMALGINQY